MRHLRLSLVALALVPIGCTTAVENVAEATEPVVSASTTAVTMTATTMVNAGVEAIEPVGDVLAQGGNERIDKADLGETHTPDEEAIQVTQETAPTSEAEPAQEPRPSIEARARVNRADTEVLPEWPFDGLVLLEWTGWTWQAETRWHLQFYQWTDSGAGRGWTVDRLPLPDLSIDCVGDIGLISHGPGGIELGGPAGSVSGSFLMPWGGTPQRLDAPSDELLAEIRSRLSNVDAEVTGDIVSLGHDDGSVRFALHEPARSEGDWWNVQARHDGDVFVVTVHPGNHPCFSGVTWLSAAATGEMLSCGVDTAATRFIASDAQAKGPLVLPAADEYSDVLSCPYPLDP